MARYIKIATDDKGNYYIGGTRTQPEEHYIEVSDKRLREIRKIIEDYEEIQMLLDYWCDREVDEQAYAMAKGYVWGK